MQEVDHIKDMADREILNYSYDIWLSNKDKPYKSKNALVFVYLIGTKKQVKIGQTKNILRRVDSLQSSCPVNLEFFAYFPGCIAIERGLHWKFRRRRTHGEWFNRSYDIDSFISAAKDFMNEKLTTFQNWKPYGSSN